MSRSTGVQPAGVISSTSTLLTSGLKSTTNTGPESSTNPAILGTGTGVGIGGSSSNVLAPQIAPPLGVIVATRNCKAYDINAADDASEVKENEDKPDSDFFPRKETVLRPKKKEYEN